MLRRAGSSTSQSIIITFRRTKPLSHDFGLGLLLACNSPCCSTLFPGQTSCISAKMRVRCHIVQSHAWSKNLFRSMVVNLYFDDIL